MTNQQFMDLCELLKERGDYGLRLVARVIDGTAYIVAYEPAETALEASELPIGFVTATDQGDQLVVASPSPPGTYEGEGFRVDAERRELLGALVGRAEAEREKTRSRPKG